MIERRQLFPLSAALAAFAKSVGSREALAKLTDVKIDPYNQSPEQEEYHSSRLPMLDQQSAQDFFSSFRVAMGKEFRPMAKHLTQVLADKGINLDDDVSMEEAWDLVLNDPVYAMSSRTWVSGQQLMWSNIRSIFHDRADEFLAELEKTDKSGPGTLELNPDMEIPDYTRYEIHIQPGGYVGDPFAGAISQYGFKQFDRSFYNNDRLQHHLTMAQETPLPRDGKVNRILDMGTGFGALATSLKERFPDAEVWGVDIGAPMVRWAHYRAVQMNLDVNFAQRLAEDTKFEDQSFDIVVSYIMHHEVHPEAHAKIIAEAYRILRPGGVFYPIDFVTRGNPANPGNRHDILRKAAIWRDHRYNHEVWSPGYRDTDFPGLMKTAGFVDMTVTNKPGTSFHEVFGYKPV